MQVSSYAGELWRGHVELRQQALPPPALQTEPATTATFWECFWHGCEAAASLNVAVRDVVQRLPCSYRRDPICNRLKRARQAIAHNAWWPATLVVRLINVGAPKAPLWQWYRQPKVSKPSVTSCSGAGGHYALASLVHELAGHQIL